MKCPHCHKTIPPASPGKIKYSQYVEMTATQFKWLLEKFGFKQTANLICKLDQTIPNHRPQGCHYQEILSWVVDELGVKPLHEKKPEQEKEPEFKIEEPINRGSEEELKAIAEAKERIKESTRMKSGEKNFKKSKNLLDI